jgi:hypothetical protein
VQNKSLSYPRKSTTTTNKTKREQRQMQQKTDVQCKQYSFGKGFLVLGVDAQTTVGTQPHFWDNELLRKTVTVVVALDGSVNLKDDVKVKVSDCGGNLIVKQKLVKLLEDVDSYFRKKDTLSYPPYHPKIVGFHKYLKAIWNKHEEEIFNTAHILLPFQVQTDVTAIHKFTDASGVRLVYVDLRGEKKDDYIAASEPSVTHLD